MSGATTLGANLCRRRAAHRPFALAATLVALAFAPFLSGLGIGAQLGLVLPAVLLLGVPHGAFDLVVAVRGEHARGRRSARFAARYLVLALLVVAAWAIWPALSLGVFLVLSALHFGRGDAYEGGGEGALEVAVRGSLPIVLPAAFHPAAVGTLFAWLLGSSPERVEAALAVAAPWLVAVWASAAVAYALRTLSSPDLRGAGLGRASLAVAELALLASTAYALPPLVSFALYFCAWHGARHLIALDDLLAGRGRGVLVRAALAPLAATLVLMAIGYAWTSSSTLDPAAAVRTLFVGLAALTVPHVAVTARLERALRSRGNGTAAAWSPAAGVSTGTASR